LGRFRNRPGEIRTLIPEKMEPYPGENGNIKIDLDSEEVARIVKALEHYHAYLSQQLDGNGRYLRLAERLSPPEVSIRLETFDRARYRQALRKYTDLELILSGASSEN
jgi:hypothetical protein